jgi:DNA topoisomerase-1
VKPLRELGEHPSGGAVAVYEGRYGPYVKWDKVNATLPKETDPAAVTLEEAVALVDAKKGTKKAPAKKAAGGEKKAAAGGAKKAATGAAKKKAAPKKKVD